MKVKDMLISDVLVMPVFVEAIKNEINDLLLSRDAGERNALSKGGKLAAHPIDYLRKMGYMAPGQFIIEYANVLNKKSELSSSQRGFILVTGNNVFFKVVEKLQENEKKTNKRGRNNRQ